MAKRELELSPTQVARILEIHPDTVRAWAKAALAGEQCRLKKIRRDIVGRFWFDKDEVLEMQREQAQSA